MSVRAKIERLERLYPPLDMSPEGRKARRQSLVTRDAVAMEMVVRMTRHLKGRYLFASEEEKARAHSEDPMLVALRARFDERVSELESGAAPANDFNERVRRMFHHLPPLGWAGPWPFEDAA